MTNSGHWTGWGVFASNRIVPVHLTWRVGAIVSFLQSLSLVVGALLGGLTRK